MDSPTAGTGEFSRKYHIMMHFAVKLYRISPTAICSDICRNATTMMCSEMYFIKNSYICVLNMTGVR